MRIGKTYPSEQFTEGGMATDWYHVPCMLKVWLLNFYRVQYWIQTACQALRRARKTTKKINDESDLENLETLSAEDKKFVLKCITSKWVNRFL